MMSRANDDQNMDDPTIGDEWAGAIQINEHDAPPVLMIDPMTGQVNDFIVTICSSSFVLSNNHTIFHSYPGMEP